MWSAIWILVSRLIQIWLLADRSQNEVNSFPCRHQSFRWMSWNRLVSVWEKLVNFLKRPISQWWRKWKSDLESVSRIEFYRCIQQLHDSNYGSPPIYELSPLSSLTLMCTLQPQSNGPLYSNTVIGTLAVDGWAITFGTARKGLSGLWPRPVPSSLYQM